ncbi:MAG: DUF1080 domain-containing protein [Pirellulaceae bacterium]|nr:DUF1080 domain-containing protein [Pirellulaceae bacterium]
MKTWLVLTLALLAGYASAADNQPPEGFVALFNGQDLSGWEGAVPIHKRLSESPEWLSKEQEKANGLMKEHWKVEDGALVNDGKGVNLASRKHFGNFELMVDWKINPKGDTGIYLRGNPQIQVWDSESVDPVRFKNEKNKGSGALWNNKKLEHKVPLVFADNPPGQWNTFHVTMIGDVVTVKLNGKLVVDKVPLDNYWEKGKPFPKRGPIELQYHPNQDGKADNLYFKNVYIKELAD